MTNKVMANFNMKGEKGKHAFTKLRLFTVVIGKKNISSVFTVSFGGLVKNRNHIIQWAPVNNLADIQNVTCYIFSALFYY